MQMPTTNKKEIIKTQITKLNPQKTKPENNKQWELHISYNDF